MFRAQAETGETRSTVMKELAPQLRHYEEFEDGWAAVVRDYLPESSLEVSNLEPIPPRALEDIPTSSRGVARRELCFGDLRKPNIMLCTRSLPDGGTEQGAVLVDFDWTGKHDFDRYPLVLNNIIKWLPGIRARGPMLKEHDDAMFELLTRSSYNL
ncbi:hypothetical protein FRC03_004402 [Tulasnella sp. 419]|nr:hypothetical protein FRC03_004402 [Tulasnella sp. 419]